MPLHYAALAGASMPASLSGTRSRALTPIDDAVRRLDDLFLGRAIPGLKTRAHKVLRVLVEAADLRQPGAINPTPSKTLEKLTNYKPRSVSGAHTDLVGLGLIERAVTLRGRRDPVWHTRLTPYCLALLFADHSQEVAPPQEKGLNPIGSQGATPLAAVDNLLTPEQPKPAEQPQDTVLDEGVHVPAVLVPLIQLLGGRAIKKAMGIAKAARVRVEHILAHRLERLRQARDPEGLLVHLIRSGEDWTRPVRAPKGAGGGMDNLDPKRARLEAQEAATRTFLEAHAGRWLARSDRTVLVEIRASGAFDHRRIVEGSWVRLPVEALAMHSLLQAVDAGRLDFLAASDAAAILGDGQAKRRTFLAQQRARRASRAGPSLVESGFAVSQSDTPLPF